VTSLSLTPVTSIDVPFNLLKSSQLIAVAADYATEIENAVGVEIYEPIFKAGIFIFFSGVVSSLIVAFIVSKSNAWEGLEDEFQKGKEAQFITLMGSKLHYLTIILMLVFQATTVNAVYTYMWKLLFSFRRFTRRRDKR
jgi:hypothetical protein